MDKNNIYRKKECNLCGAFAFEKFNKIAKTLDGGFTTIEDWERSGFGSIVINYWNLDSVKIDRFEFGLCPDCAKELDDCIHSKIEEIKTRKGGVANAK